jgi:hypothetical protein
MLKRIQKILNLFISLGQHVHLYDFPSSNSLKEEQEVYLVENVSVIWVILYEFLLFLLFFRGIHENIEIFGINTAELSWLVVEMKVSWSPFHNITTPSTSKEMLTQHLTSLSLILIAQKSKLLSSKGTYRLALWHESD